MLIKTINKKDEHIYKIRKKFGISLEATYHCNIKYKDEIEKICDVFYLKSDDSKEKVLALLLLVSKGKDDEAVRRFRKETGFNIDNFDSDIPAIKELNIFLVTALMENPSLYSMTMNFYQAVKDGLEIGETDESMFIKPKKPEIDISPVEEAANEADYDIYSQTYDTNYNDETTSDAVHDVSWQYYGITIVDILKNIRFSYLTGVETRSAQTRGESNAHIESSGHAEMIAKYEDAFQKNQKDYETCIILASLYYNRNGKEDYKKSIEKCEQALEIKQNDPIALYIRGLVRKEEGDNEKALSDLQAVLKTDFQDKKAVYYVIGVTHYYEDRLEEARKAFEEVRKLDPDFADIREVFKMPFMKKDSHKSIVKATSISEKYVIKYNEKAAAGTETDKLFPSIDYDLNGIKGKLHCVGHGGKLEIRFYFNDPDDYEKYTQLYMHIKSKDKKEIIRQISLSPSTEPEKPGVPKVLSSGHIDIIEEGTIFEINIKPEQNNA